jgi:hypothetical protein
VGDPFPIQANTAIADSRGNVYVTGSFIVDGCVVEGDEPGAVCALDANLGPRWLTRIFDDSAGLYVLGERLIAARWGDVCIALDPSTGAILDADAPLLPTRMEPDDDGSFFSDHDGEVRRYRLADRPGENERVRFGVDRVPLFEPPARGFFAKLFTSDEPPSAEGTFPMALGAGVLVTFESGPAELVQYDRAGTKSRFASISREYGLDEISDMQRVGDLIFLRAGARLFCARGGVVSHLASIDDLTAFAALPGGDLVLFGDQRVVLARRDEGYRVE